MPEVYEDKSVVFYGETPREKRLMVIIGLLVSVLAISAGVAVVQDQLINNALINGLKDLDQRMDRLEAMHGLIDAHHPEHDED